MIVEHAVTSDGRPVVEERQEIVYRDIPTLDSRRETDVNKITDAAKAGAHLRIITPHPTLLFRYSALTFNGHRIHYDRPFCIETEGYPGLVVHGPIQATMLCQFAADLRGSSPKSFRFRSLSPIFDCNQFSLNAKDDSGSGLRLWTAVSGGPVAMQACAQW